MCHSFNPASKQAVISEALRIQATRRRAGSCYCLIESGILHAADAAPKVLVAEYAKCTGARLNEHGFIGVDDNITKGLLNLYRQEMLYYFWQANQEMDGII
jgi:hypothetical protein